LLLPQFRCDNTTNSRSDRLPSFVDKHTGVVVKLDYTAIRSLPLLRRPYYNGMSYVASPYFVRCADGHAISGLGTEISLLLHDYYYAVAWSRQLLL
jgi:hypothetical protein